MPRTVRAGGVEIGEDRAGKRIEIGERWFVSPNLRISR